MDLLASPLQIYSDRLTDKNAALVEDFEYRIQRWNKRQAENMREALLAKYGNTMKAYQDSAEISEDDDEKHRQEDADLEPELLAGGMLMTPAERHTVRAIALLLWGAVEWRKLAEEARPYLDAAAYEGALLGVEQMRPYSDLSDAQLDEIAREEAAKYADDRSASMIGMKRNAKGRMVPDVEAEWPLTSVMRRDIVASARQAVQENWTAEQLAAVIEATYALSDDRVSVIGKVELNNAQTNGQYSAWVATVSEGTMIVRWRTSDDKEREIDECDGYEAMGDVPLGYEFAPGLKCPKAHPFCNCYLEARPPKKKEKA